VNKSLPRSTCKLFPVLALSACLCLCAKVEKHERHFYGLDTEIDLTVYAASSRCEAVMDSVQALIARLDSRLSISNAESEIYRINHRADSLVRLSPVIASILSVCRKEHAASRGLFDVTVEPLKLLYGLESHQKENHVPSQREIDGALSLVGFGRIRFVSDSVCVMPVGMHLDFGGIAKGYVLSEVRRLLLGKGYSNFLINTGGDMIAGGKKPSGQKWIIGVQHPRKTDALIATMYTEGGCVFTSGDYERCFVVNGKRYHHLFDPSTGIPGSHNMSATVVGDDPLAVDAAVKTAFLMPSDKALSYLSSRGMLGLLIDSAGIGWASQGLRQNLKPDSSFVVNYR
jgi:FAD:protein FMN transferase